MRYICEQMKTENGVREVPMALDVVAVFKRIIKMRHKPKSSKLCLMCNFGDIDK